MIVDKLIEKLQRISNDGMGSKPIVLEGWNDVSEVTYETELDSVVIE